MNKYSSLHRPGWKPRKRSGVSAKKIIKRSMIVAVGLLLLYLLVSAIVHLCVWIFGLGSSPKFIEAKTTVWGGQQSCAAVVLREEMVIAASREGRLNIIAESGSMVQSGDLVAEIIDEEKLMQIDEKLQELESRLDQIQTQSTPEAEQITDARLVAQLKVRESLSSYRQSRHTLDAVAINTSYEQLHAASSQFLDVRLQELQENKTREVLLAERKNLLGERESAVGKIFSPQTGYFTLGTDGLESVCQISEVTELNAEAVWKETQAKNISHGDTLDAGEIVCKVVKNESTWFMVVRLPVALREQIVSANTLQLKYDDRVLEGRLVNSQVDEDKCYLKFEIQGQPILDARHIEVNVSYSSQKGIEVPKSALFTEEDMSYIYIEQNGTLVKTPVQVLASNEEAFLVEGVGIGTKFFRDVSALKKR